MGIEHTPAGRKAIADLRSELEQRARSLKVDAGPSEGKSKGAGRPKRVDDPAKWDPKLCIAVDEATMIEKSTSIKGDGILPQKPYAQKFSMTMDGRKFEQKNHVEIDLHQLAKKGAHMTVDAEYRVTASSKLDAAARKVLAIAHFCSSNF